MKTLNAGPQVQVLKMPGLGYFQSFTKEHCLMVCALFCEELGFIVEWLDHPTIQLDLVDRATGSVIGFAACRTYPQGPVDEDCVQMLWDTMYGQKVKHGIVFSLSEVTDEARELADGSDIELFNGNDFIEKISELPLPSREKLLKLIYEMKFIAPICPRCGDAMDEVPNVVGNYWRCFNYPRCNLTYMA